MTSSERPPSRAEIEAQGLWEASGTRDRVEMESQALQEASGATSGPGLSALNAARPWEQRSRRAHIEANLFDAVTDLLYYDRKEDETLPVGAIEEAVAAGEITVDEMIALFAETLRRALTEGV